MKTPGQAAYDAWKERRDGGAFVRPWERLYLEARDDWHDIATAAIERQRINCCPLCEGNAEKDRCPHDNVSV